VEKAMLQHHLQETYQFLFDEAHRALSLGGSFRPFGAGTRKTGELIQTTVDSSQNPVGPQDHIAGLIAGFRADDRQNGLIVAGLVFDGQMTESGALHGRALVFHIEAANGRAIEVVVPYEMRLGGVIDFAAPATTEVLPEIFVDA
jgi:hypothetical protein